MFRRCLFCRARFAPNDALVHVPRGRRVAYDPERGRLWAVCDRCYRWNLVPVEDREAALHELERMARDRAKTLGRTANVSLLAAPPLTLVRVGDAELTEQAHWRYGRVLTRRKESFESPRARVAAYTFGAMRYVGEWMGLADEDVTIDWTDAPVADVLRWRRFGWAAWHGRQTCPSCHSTLRALRYDLAWWVYPLRGPDGTMGVGVPCQRCDPWTPDKVYELHGQGAENVLRRLLAYLNIAGASERRISQAVRRIEDAGSAGEFALRAAERRVSLWKMRGEGTVGLEIALTECVEQRLQDLEVRALEYLWKREEELARIIDEQLTPRRVLEAHLRKLPIKVRPALGRVTNRPLGT